VVIYLLLSEKETISGYPHRANEQESAIVLLLPVVAIVNVNDNVFWSFSSLKMYLVLVSCFTVMSAYEFRPVL
jgi:hypothetical protein